MSWDDHNRRRAAIRAVLADAARRPGRELDLDAVPRLREIFTDRRELLLALQYDWTQALWARIEVLSLDPKARHLTSDALARTAWSDCAARHPALRMLLDRHRDELGAAVHREQDFLVSAGLGHTADQRVYRTQHVA